ncbi:uncharacterized protein G2W53_006018 [Senna tora]|uniref:Uncharacterized protein n=1 Tax=Senna tora TaxID=362788 RepID=A0A835CBW9_9FABA|nr:uncharacterized protein G2W53_006018 [Senna tora]
MAFSLKQKQEEPWLMSSLLEMALVTFTSHVT